MELFQTELICNLRVILDSQFLLKEQVAAMARGPLHRFSWCISCAIFWTKRPLLLGHLPFELLQWAAGSSLEDHLEASLILEQVTLQKSPLDHCTSWKLPLIQNYMQERVCHSGLMFHKLHWLSFSFHVQFKVLFITHKAFHGIGPFEGPCHWMFLYVRLSQAEWPCFNSHSSNNIILQKPVFILGGVPILWIDIHPDSVLFHLDGCELLKTWVFSKPLGKDGCQASMFCLCVHVCVWERREIGRQNGRWNWSSS